MKVENHLSVFRQRYSHSDREKQTIQQLFQDETSHRQNLQTKLQQSEVRKSLSYIVQCRRIEL